MKSKHELKSTWENKKKKQKYSQAFTQTFCVDPEKTVDVYDELCNVWS